MSKTLGSTIRLAYFISLGVFLSSSVVGQENSNAGERPSQTLESMLTFPAAEGLLTMQVLAPQEVRMGESYHLTATISNTSDSVELHDIQIEATASGPIELQSSAMGKPQNESRKQQNAGQDQQGANESGQAQGEEQQNQAGSSQSPAEAGTSKWTIPNLSPGESRQIQIQAVGDEQKEGGLCFSIVSYRQSLCVNTKITKPELEITKTAPQEATLCDVFEFTYTVKNSGTGDLGAFTVEDALPQGLETESGDTQLKFDVDQLKAGDTRQFKAEIRAVSRGEFSSRAVAKAKNSDLKNQSKKVTTTIKGPELAVAIDGPGTNYKNRPAEYNVRITNLGNQAVDEGLLELTFPTVAEFSGRGEFHQTNNTVANAHGEGSTQQPKAADERQTTGSQTTGSQTGSAGGSSSQGGKMERRAMSFRGLKAGETVQTSFMLRGLDEQSNRIVAKASYRCRTSDGQETLTSSMANTTTRVVSLPALLVSVVDEEDPVQVGNEVAYKIVVHNQGTAPDKNVQITATLPDNMTFENVSGETSATNDGKSVTFDKVDEIKAGETLTWTLKATAEQGAEDVRFQIEVKSDGLPSAVKSQEPTQLFGEGLSDTNSP